MRTEIDEVSRMTIVTEGNDQILDQVTKQLNRLIDTIKVVDLSGIPKTLRELALIKINYEHDSLDFETLKKFFGVDNEDEIIEIFENINKRNTDKKDRIFLEKINKRVGKSINHYNLINENDIVLIALSGGKDSMVMLDALSWRLRNLPIKYKLIAVHVKLAGLSYQINEKELQNFCSSRNVELIIKT